MRHKPNLRKLPRGRPHSRLRGTIPVGNLDVLSRDRRRQPSGWFAPRVGELPAPLRSAPPILVTEIMPDPTPLAEPTEPPEREGDAEKISDDLWPQAPQSAFWQKNCR